MKLEAIEMTCSRYVYVIPHKLGGELMGVLLKDPDMKVRLGAAHSLGYNGLAGEHFDGIVALFKQVDGDGIRSLIYAMGRSRDARFYPYLRDLLKHEDGMIRAEAIFELRHWPHDREKVRDDAMKLWNDPHQQVRCGVLAFVDVDSKDGLALLRERLKDAGAHVRTYSVECLGRSKQPGVDEIIVGMMTDPEAIVRGKAIETLGNRKAKEHVDLAIGRFQDAKEDLYVRRVAVKAMAQLASANHVPILRAMFGDADSQVRDYAMEVVNILEGRPR